MTTEEQSKPVVSRGGGASEERPSTRINSSTAGQAGAKSRSPFVDIPHPTRFFYDGQPWFLPLAAQYFRARDMVS